MAMKREKKSSKLTRFAFACFIAAGATFAFVGISHGKTISSTTDEGVVASVQQDPQSTKKDTPLVEVEEMPVFPGGDIAILKYIADNTVYPEDAKKRV